LLNEDHQSYRPLHIFLDNMTSIEHPWHPQKQGLLLMKHLEKEKTWAPHGQDGWYIGPALEHYRCYTVYVTKTRSNRIVETVDFFSHKFELTFPSSSELVTQAAADLTHALSNPQPAGPFCQVGNEQAIALRRLAIIFEAARSNRGSKKLTPQNEVENNTPQRVQTTVAPPRVASQAPDQMAIQHII
jgi:hypothetical protein